MTKFANIALEQATDEELRIACRTEGYDEFGRALFDAITGDKKLTKKQRALLYKECREDKYRSIRVDLDNRVTGPNSLVDFDSCGLQKVAPDAEQAAPEPFTKGLVVQTSPRTIGVLRSIDLIEGKYLPIMNEHGVTIYVKVNKVTPVQESKFIKRVPTMRGEEKVTVYVSVTGTKTYQVWFNSQLPVLIFESEGKVGLHYTTLQGVIKTKFFKAGYQAAFDFALKKLLG